MLSAATRLSPLVAIASATGRTHADQSLEYLLKMTASSRPEGTEHEIDCMWRKLAYRYAPTLQPWVDDSHLRMLHDALELDILCSEVFEPSSVKFQPSTSIVAGSVKAFVDPAQGSDSNAGTLAHPLRTLSAGVTACGKASGSCDLLLRGGTYYLDDTVQITEEHNGMRIAAYNGEEVVVSGGRKITGLTWKPDEKRKGVFVASLKEHASNLPRGVPALRHDGIRATLARFPNANAELDIFPKGYITDGTDWELPTFHGEVCDPDKLCGESKTEVIPDDLSWHGMFQNWTVGHGGNCEKYDPPLSPWCSAEFYLLRQFPEMHTRSPSGVSGLQHLPNAPYNKQDGAIVHAWRPGHWYTWMFEVGNETTPVDTVDHWSVYENMNAIFGQIPAPKKSTDGITYLGEFSSADECWSACNTSSTCNNFAWHHADFDGWATQCYGIAGTGWAAQEQDGVTSGRGPYSIGGSFIFKAGGNQGGEGNDQGGEWFIEGVEEELDAENEYFYDAEKQLLFFFPNSTETPLSEIVVPTLDTFLDLVGSHAAPVRNITFEGITFTESRPTFMEPRGQPSGGDWSLERQGALRLEGTESVVIKNCLFTRLDTNAISINGYNRHTTVDRNEFVWLGQNAIASWGRADKNDGRSGNVPLFNTITNNFVHEIGHYQKQSSFYFQAETALARVENNIVFNIPRAGINFNDGFGGGAEVMNNLMFNTCRESGDHGAFNSWDRLPYITTFNDGTPSTVPKVNNIHNNFIVANYAADGGCLDNDDGSAYYDIHHNFCMYGGHKQNFDGHSKRSFGNIHVHPQVYGTKCIDEEAQGWTEQYQGLPPPGYAEEYTDNICILPNAGDTYMRAEGGSLDDLKTFKTGMVLRNNTIYIPGGDANSVVTVGGEKISFSEFQDRGFDPTSRVIAGKPSVSQIVSWAEPLLGLSPEQEDLVV